MSEPYSKEVFELLKTAVAAAFFLDTWAKIPTEPFDPEVAVGLVEDLYRDVEAIEPDLHKIIRADI